MKRTKPFFRLLAIAIAAFMILQGGFCSSVLPVSAKSVTSYNQLQKVLPAGTTLTSDMFPGMNVLYDGKKSIEVNEGINNVSLTITITDPLMAKKSLPALKFLFGSIDLELKAGTTKSIKSKVTGITAEKYKTLVNTIGDNNYKKLLIQILEGENIGQNMVSSFSDAIIKVAQASAYEEFAAAVKEAEEEAKAKQIAQQQALSQPANTGSADAGAEEKGSDKPAEYDADRTILLFLNGSDLESDKNSATFNLLDLLTAQIPDNTRIFITTGGTKTWHMDDYEAYKKYAKKILYPDLYDSALQLPENAAKLKQVEDKALELYNSYRTAIAKDIQIYEVQKGEVNELVLLNTIPGRYMLEHSYLTEFIDYVANNSNAQKYDLVMWDHGGGIRGFGVDEIYNKDVLDKVTGERSDVGFNNIETLKKAIGESEFIKNGNRFDFIGFDACQMAVYEADYVLKDYADYLIVSEENEPADGWDYYSWMNALYNNKTMATTELAANIIDSYVAQFSGNNITEATLSLIDTEKLSDVQDALSVFAEYLVRDYLDAEYHDSILITIGKKGDFANKTGCHNDGYLDLIHLCTPFMNNGKGAWNQDLMDAADELWRTVDAAVLNTKGTVGNNNNGLSINVPLEVLVRSYAGKDSSGEPLYYTYTKGDLTAKAYDQMTVNEAYKKAYAQMALNKLAAIAVGDLWLKPTKDIDTDYVVKYLKNNENTYYSADITKAAGADLSNTSDPVRESIENLVNNRVALDNVEISYGNDGNGTIDTSDVATIEIENINPAVMDDDVNVDVVLKVGNNKEILLGTTPLYTQDRNGVTEGNTRSWNIRKFDNEWYLINNQIADFTILDYDAGSQTYNGYIRLGLWWNNADAAGSAGGDRDQYVKEKLDKKELIDIYLNVTGNYDPDTGKSSNLTPINYTYHSEGYDSTGAKPLTSIENCYFEILGGMGSVVNSLGTIYSSRPEGNQSGNIFSLDMKTVMDLSPNYYLSDAYGCDYEFSDQELKSGTAAQKEKSLSSFKNDAPQDAITFADSLALAEGIRNQAAGTNQSNNVEGGGGKSLSDAPVETSEIPAEETAPVEAAPAETSETPAEETAPVEAAPAETSEVPAEEKTPVEAASAETTPAETSETPAEETAPVETTPAETTEAPAEEPAPAEPAQETNEAPSEESSDTSESSEEEKAETAAE